MPKPQQLYFVWQAPKARYRNSFNICCALLWGTSKAAVLRRAAALPMFELDRSQDWQRKQALAITGGTTFYL